MRPSTWYLLAVGGVLVLILAGWAGLNLATTQITQYQPPPATDEDLFADDRLDDKKPVFDPSRADRRPLGEWLVNQSAAVIRLDCPLVKPDSEGELLELHPSYAAAVWAMADQDRWTVLPSVNMLDGKAKQFDDGLYAALDQAWYRGLDQQLPSSVQMVRRLHDRVGKDSIAAPFLAAGLELAGITVPVADRAAKDLRLQRFEANELLSRPSGFYTWNDTLRACYRFMRFFQHEFEIDDLAVPLALSWALAEDKALTADYRKVIEFHARLTNPKICLSLLDVKGLKTPAIRPFIQVCTEQKVTRHSVAVLPLATMRETVLFEKLFPLGPPQQTNLMREFVQRIRSGEVDLKPGQASGWYDYQVYALETMLLPERGAESERLLLSRAYKKRMLEAFQALITKRRETHLGVGSFATAMARPPSEVKPRLRVEPCPSYYLRTARAYAFLADFLEAALGQQALQKLHGLKQDGERKADLFAELQWTRDLFYGLYLVSADDIGLKPGLLPDEPVDSERCYRQAVEWLPRALEDEDLAADTRVAVPIVTDPIRGITRHWATLGVRLAKLEARYERPPQIKLAHPEATGPTPAESRRGGVALVEGDGRDWQPLASHTLATASFLIPVDEFAEVEVAALRALPRETLRDICDREKTKPAIVAALRLPPGAHPPIPWEGVPYWSCVVGFVVAVALGIVLPYVWVRRRLG